MTEDEAKGFAGKLNIYTCRSCQGHVVTRDIDSGVTPFTIDCRAKHGCDGMMQSSMYRVFDQSMRESFQWRRPSAIEVLTQGEQQHVEQGGLLLYKADEQLARLPERDEAT